MTYIRRGRRHYSDYTSLVPAILIFLWIIGYIWNIVLLCQADFKAPYKVEVMRGAAVIMVPLGGIVGYITINDHGKEKANP